MINLKKAISIALILALGYISLNYYNNSTKKYNYHKTLGEYISLPENIDTNLKLTEKQRDDENKLTILSYTYESQIWPKTGLAAEQKTWQHTLNLYIPDQIHNKTALLWINGGINELSKNSDQNKQNFPAYPLNFKQIANKTHTIVIDLQNIPNQYITLDGKQYAEDGLVAYTWSKFIKNPKKYKYYPAYLPMVKSVVIAMNNVENINLDNKNIHINNFVISGLSKRGLTTWLTSLQDDRVQAIIPVSIDILDFKKNIEHIYQSHQSWPIALHDYYEQNVVQRLSDPNAVYLEQINDPYQYINCAECSKNTKKNFITRASIKKYIISASGDDFFTPDSPLLYYNKLPGQNYLRYIPNSRHYIDNTIVSDAITTYLYNINHNIELPELYTYISNNNSDDSADVHSDNHTNKNYTINISTDTLPKSLKLYTAHNRSNRDFRLASGIEYQTQELPINLSNYSEYIYNKTGIWNVQVPIKYPEDGWQASFVELEFDTNNQDIPSLKLTSPIQILPHQYPEIKQKENSIKANLADKLNKIKQYGKRVIYCES